MSIASTLLLTAFDAYLASDQPLHTSAEKLFQGPVADALTHVGQIAMMRRLAGAPIKGENYCCGEDCCGTGWGGPGGSEAGVLTAEIVEEPGAGHREQPDAE